MEIKHINREEASKIIETRKPLGLFYEVDGDLHVGIDNSTSDAWVEEFETKEECLDWLRGNTEGTSEEKEDYLTELQRKQSQLMEHYGKDRQLEKLVEECAELIKAIMKTKTNKVSYIDDDVLHEMADVKNLIQQFELKQNRLKDTVDLIIMCKVNRQLERIEKGEQ